MGKNSRSGFGMNNPDHISESLETIFWVKIFKFFDADPESGMEKFGFGILDAGKNSDPGCTKFGSGITSRIRNSGCGRQYTAKPPVLYKHTASTLMDNNYRYEESL